MHYKFSLPVRALKAAAKITMKDPVRPLMNLIHIDENGIYATDSYIAYRYKVDLRGMVEKPIAFEADFFKTLKGRFMDSVVFSIDDNGLWHLEFSRNCNPSLCIREFDIRNNTMPSNINRLFDEHVLGKRESIGLSIKFLDKIIKAAKVVNGTPNLRFDFEEPSNKPAIITSTNSDDLAEFLIMPVRL